MSTSSSAGFGPEGPADPGAAPPPVRPVRVRPGPVPPGPVPPGPKPPGPVPPGPVPPGPVPPGPAPFNPHVESHLEAGLAEDQLIFSEQKEGLRRLESDLASLEAPSSSFFEDIMLKAVTAVFDAFVPLIF